MELTRSSLAPSGAPNAFWNYAVTHAVDILIRTSGPPNTNASSHELFTGEKPRIMSILPFACRAYAVKPPSVYSKTRMDSRAWVGVNLGRSVRSPGAYHIWVPSSNRIVVASDVYFNERSFLGYRHPRLIMLSPILATPTEVSHLDCLFLHARQLTRPCLRRATLPPQRAPPPSTHRSVCCFFSLDFLATRRHRFLSHALRHDG
eukprot:2731294-Pleurochrysis_carterae.AAC.1